jgi:hypothetical protein
MGCLQPVTRAPARVKHGIGLSYTGGVAELPIACTLSPAELDGRRERWQRLAARARAGSEPTAAGARLSFRPLPGVEEELRELARLEADCCAFARFRVHADERAVVLDVAADGPEAVAAARSMFLPSG